MTKLFNNSRCAAVLYTKLSLLFLMVFTLAAFQSCDKKRDEVKVDTTANNAHTKFDVPDNVVFLGGTVNKSTWRDELIPMLKVNYYNPVCDNWTPEKQQEEIEVRQKATYVLYVLTPRLTGYYSIAEVVDDSNKRPEKTILCILDKDGEFEFTDFQKRSMGAVSDLVKNNGGHVCASLEEIADFLNTHMK